MLTLQTLIILSRFVLPTVPDNPLVIMTESPLFISCLSMASSSTLLISVSDPTRDPTSMACTALCKRMPYAAHSLGVTAKT